MVQRAWTNRVPGATNDAPQEYPLSRNPLFELRWPVNDDLKKTLEHHVALLSGAQGPLQ